MDLDTVAVESDIAFPLADYEGKDLVLWIQPDLVLQGDAFRKPTSLLSCCAIFFTLVLCFFGKCVAHVFKHGLCYAVEWYCISGVGLL